MPADTQPRAHARLVQRPSRLVLALRWLALVALVLSIVCMSVFLYGAWKVQRVVSNFTNSVTGPPPDECWTNGAGQEICAPGGKDGKPGGN